MIRIITYILICMFFGWLLCDIEPSKEYSWYSGIWHGLFFIPNWIRSWFGDALYKAENYTTAYNISWWIFTILSTISFLFGSFSKPENRY